MKINLTIIISMLFVLSLQAQKQSSALWNKKHADDILWLNQRPDGKLIVGAKDGITCFNHLSGDVEWETKLSMNSEGIEHFEPYPIFATHGKNVIVGNGLTGDIIYNSKSKEASSHARYFLGDIMVMELKKDKHLYLLGIDLTNSSIIWETKIKKIGGGGLMGGLKAFASLNGSIQKPAILNEAPLIVNNQIIFYHDKSIYGVDKSTGAVIWENEYDENIQELFENGSELFMPLKKYVFCIDSETGTEKWSRKFEKKVKKFEIIDELNSIIILDKKKLYALDISSGSEKYVNEYKDGISDFEINRASYELYTSSKKILSIYDLDKGTVKSSIEAESDIYGIVNRNNEIALLTRKGLNIYLKDLEKLRWPKPVRGTTSRDIVDYEGGYLIFVDSQLDEKSGVSRVSKDGESLWYKSIDGFDLGYHIYNENILLYTNTKINMINLTNGDETWEKEIEIIPATTWDLDAEKGLMAIYSRGLHIIDLESGWKHRPKKQIDFKKINYGEDQVSVSIKEYGIFMRGKESIGLVDFKGIEKYNIHYKESGMNGLAKFGLGLLSTAATVGSMASMMDDSYGYLSGQNGQLGSERSENLIGVAQYSSRTKNARVEASYSSDHTLMMLMKFEDKTQGFGLIDTKTGQLINKAVFKDKDPLFMVDEHDGVVFVVDKKKDLTAFSFQ